MSRQIVITYPQSSTTYLGTTTNVIANSPLNLLINNCLFGGYERTITLSSTANLSGINFTISGEDLYRNVISEVLAGPNNNTVPSVNQYRRIISIVPNGSAASTITVGTGTDATFQWITLDRDRKYFQTSIQAVVSNPTGHLDYTINQTLDDPEDFINGQAILNTPTQFPIDATLTTTDINALYYLQSPAIALLPIINSDDGTSSFTLTIDQQGN